MFFHRLSLLLIIGLLASGCGDHPTIDMMENSDEKPVAKTDKGTITGRVSPPGIMPLIVALRNGIDITNTLADEDGWYTLPNLPPGEYSLQVVADGFFTDISNSHLQVEAGETLGADLVILRAQTEAATLHGRVVDQLTGQPLPGVEVQIECSTGVCAPLRAASDSEGKFSMEIWSSLASNINLQKLGYRTKPIQVEALQPGQKFDLGQIQLEPLN